HALCGNGDGSGARSERDAVAGFRNIGFPAQTLVQHFLQHLHFLQFAVNQIQLGAGLEMADPIDQLGLARMCGEAAESMHPGSYRDALMQQLDGLSTVDNGPTQSAAGLKARNDQVTFLAPEVVLEVVQDPSAVTHAATGDDDCAAFEAVDG